ncbi:hypothetical protein [uncultured Jatrophihabitans sp.]
MHGRFRRRFVDAVASTIVHQAARVVAPQPDGQFPRTGTEAGRAAGA